MVKICMQVGVVHYYENAHLLKHRSENTCTFEIYDEVDLVTKTLYCKTKYALNLKLDTRL